MNGLRVRHYKLFWKGQHERSDFLQPGSFCLAAHTSSSSCPVFCPCLLCPAPLGYILAIGIRLLSLPIISVPARFLRHSLYCFLQASDSLSHSSLHPSFLVWESARPAPSSPTGETPTCYEKVLCHKNGWPTLHYALLFSSKLSTLIIYQPSDSLELMAFAGYFLGVNIWYRAWLRMFK